jgi:hypothetical protein
MKAGMGVEHFVLLRSLAGAPDHEDHLFQGLWDAG